MHDLYPQKRPPTLPAFTWGFVIATFLPPVFLCWYEAALAPNNLPVEWWHVAIPLGAAILIGAVLGCVVSSDLPVGCAILLSPLIPTALWFALGTVVAMQSLENTFYQSFVWVCLWSLIALILSTPTAGVFVLTRWLVKGRV